MSIITIMQKLGESERTDLPSFDPGDTVRVQVKIRKAKKSACRRSKEWLSEDRGTPGELYRSQDELGQGVERIFPYTPRLSTRWKGSFGEVRRAKLFYLRGLRGKAARLKELDTRTTVQ